MFPCTQCGLCCKNIIEVEALYAYDRGDGVCRYFCEESNLCGIYENRPHICRVDTMYDRIYHRFFTKIAFYEENAKVCNILQEQDGVEKTFRVIIGE